MPADPLRFRDTKRYTDRLQGGAREDRISTTRSWSRTARIGGQQAVVAVMEFEFIGGSMGAAVGEGIVAAAQARGAAGGAADRVHRLRRRAHAGGRDQPDADAAHVIATRLVKEAGLPFIVVLTDPTTGGVTASFADAGRHPHRRAGRADRLRRRRA